MKARRRVHAEASFLLNKYLEEQDELPEVYDTEAKKRSKLRELVILVRDEC